MSTASPAVDTILRHLLPYCPTLRRFIFDEEVSEIEVNPDRKVFIERDGITESAGIQIEIGEAENFCKHAARWLGRDISDYAPILSTRMVDGSRISMACPPVAPSWCFTIRKFGNRRFSLRWLCEQGAVPAQIVKILREIISERRNLVVSGGTSTGKTTFLTALVSEFPDSDRVVLIEDTSEIFCRNDNVVRFEAWPGKDATAAITIRDLLKHALRFTPSRLIIGEVRDAAAYDLLQALNTGHSGSFSTVHADSAVLALQRISSLALSAQPNLDAGFLRQETASAIHYVLHIRREMSGVRRVEELIKVSGYDTDSGEFLTESLYKF